MKFVFSLSAFSVAFSLQASGVTLGTIQDFSGGLGGWDEGGPSPNPPTIVTGGGPDGSDHLQNISGGSGPGSRLAMFNTSSTWSGDYLAAGANFISLDARNSSSGTVINLRIAFNGPGGWFASDPVALASDNTWNDVLYDLSGASMNYVSGGTGTYADTMSNVTNFEIFSSASSLNVGGGGSGIVRGDVMSATLGIDNISAVAIPEVSTTGLLALIGLGALRRRR